MKNGNDIVLTAVSVSFGEKTVLRDFSHVFPVGKTSVVMGPSGCGKTTLLSLLASFIKPDAGHIDGVPERVAYVFQENRLCDAFSALRNIRLITGKTLPDDVILEHLSALGLDATVSRQPVETYSGGMKRRAAIARAVCYDADLLLLDEPFKGLDAETKQTAMQYVREHSVGKTVICVTHDSAVSAFFGGELLLLQ